MQVAAVLGSPIAHSLSPTLHEAAYHALGFSDWEYTKIECEADELPEVVGEASPEMRGVLGHHAGERSSACLRRYRFRASSFGWFREHLSAD